MIDGREGMDKRLPRIKESSSKALFGEPLFCFFFVRLGVFYSWLSSFASALITVL